MIRGYRCDGHGPVDDYWVASWWPGPPAADGVWEVDWAPGRFAVTDPEGRMIEVEVPWRHAVAGVREGEDCRGRLGGPAGVVVEVLEFSGSQRGAGAGCDR
jgi:hypothetical protein